MKKQKRLALLLALVMLLGVTGIAVSAEGESGVLAGLRIEGLEECLYVNEACTLAGDVKTVADLVRSLSGVEGFPDVTITEGQFGAYVSDVNGVSEMSHGEMSGWLFLVNGTVSTVGMAGYDIADGDDIVIFFSDLYGALGMQIPIVDTSRLLTDGIIKFTSKDTSYDEDWNETTEIKPIVGATVEFDEAKLITDENGEVVVAQSSKLAGLHNLQIERYDEESGMPTVLRFAPDYKLFVPFADMVEDAWYARAVEYCVRAEKLEGMGGNMFAPDASMTMAQLVKVLSRIADVDTTAAEGELWYAPALEWAAGEGIIPAIIYSPNGNITREIFIYMFYKTAELAGNSDMTKTADITGAADYDSISKEYQQAVAWAVAAGIITGVDSSTLTINPEGTVSRAVVCQMLMKYYG